jgi:flagellar FliL protein
MGKDKVKDDDKVDVDDIAEGSDEDVAAAAPAVSPLQNLLRSRLVKILGYSLIAILLIIVSVVIANLVIEAKLKKSPLNVQDQRWEEKKPDPLATFDIGEFKLNTADKDEPRFLHVQVYLGYDEKDVKVIQELNARKIQIVDELNQLFGSRTKDQLDDIEKQKELKEMLKEKINQLLQSGEVREVYFPVFSLM